MQLKSHSTIRVSALALCFCSHVGETQAQAEYRALPGMAFNNSKYVISVPAEVSSCPDAVQQKAAASSPMVKGNPKQTVADRVPIWIDYKHANFISARKLTIEPPIEVTRLANLKWVVVGKKPTRQIQLEPAIQINEHQAPCWILISSNWRPFEKYPKTTLRPIVLVSKQFPNSIWQAAPGKSYGQQEISSSMSTEIETIVARIPILKKRVNDFFVEDDKSETKVPLKWSAMQYQKFESTVGGKVETFLNASLYGRTGGGIQATFTVNVDRSLLCRWHEGGEDSVHGLDFIGRYRMSRLATDNWSVAEWYYEGGNRAIYSPIISDSSCELTMVVRSAYSGL